MNTMDNAKVIETLEKQTLYNYFDKLIHAPMRKITLFSIFPFSAAPNLSDPRHFVILDDVAKLSPLNAGCWHN